MKNLPERMFEYRAKNNLSMEKFAKMCHLSTQTVWSVENGQQKPGKMTTAKIEMVISKENEE